MTTEFKTVRLTGPNTSNTTAFERPSTQDENMTETTSSVKGKGKARTIFTSSSSGSHVDLHSSFTSDSADRSQLYTYKRPGPNELNPEGTLQQLPPPTHQPPNEIVLKIIQHLAQQRDLHQCTLVCKSFNMLLNPLLWHAPILGNDTASALFLSGMIHTSTRTKVVGQYTRQLSLRGRYWTDTRFTRLLPHVRGLEHLIICSRATITDASFQHLARHCQQLKTLEICSATLTQPSFLALGHYGHQLERLRLHYCAGLPSNLFDLISTCPLQVLELECPTSAAGDDDDDEHMWLTGGIQKCHRLTSLKIYGPSAKTIHHLLHQASSTTTTSDSNSNTSSCWPQLTKLDLMNCNMIDDATLVPFIKSHPHLQDLHLEASCFTDASLDAMASDALPQLACVYFTKNPHISSNGVRRLVWHGLGLVSVKIFGCRHIQSAHFPVPRFSYTKEVVMDQAVIDMTRLQQPQQ